MSLVAYGSSDESSDGEVIANDETIERKSKIPKIEQISAISKNVETPELFTVQFRSDINLPAPKCVEHAQISDEHNSFSSKNHSDNNKINFNLLPKPKCKGGVENRIEDDNDYIPQSNSIVLQFEKPIKENTPVKISIPSLSEFKDIDEEKDISKRKIKPSKKGSGLFAVLPPPKSNALLISKPLIPNILTNNPANSKISRPQQQSTVESKNTMIANDKTSLESTIAANCDSNSEDEDSGDNNASKMDFFSLSTTGDVSIPSIPITDIINETLKYSKTQSLKTNISTIETSTQNVQQPKELISNKVLVSNVINLPKEEIIQKNKAEVGPKLPVPEQEYNIDSSGNVVFDDKAIEYLCGKRGVKRKNKELESVDIIEINGEDIKPDEREWLVKALTEEPVTRPISQGAGPSGQSKKKHQITYLAHQAKAMEIELKNQWAQNKMTRQQTQSKYGF